MGTNFSEYTGREQKYILVTLNFMVLLFLEYRAELYWRLENKRMKALSKENSPLNGVSADQNNNVDDDSKRLNEEVSENGKKTTDGLSDYSDRLAGQTDLTVLTD